MKRILPLIVFVLTYNFANSQCSFNPTVANGNVILCPNESDTLTTQTYDSYQWFKGTSQGNLSAIAGAIDPELIIDYFNDAGYYFAVEATEAGCSEMSPPILVDGWAFLPPAVMTTGNFIIGPSGETIICSGDTVFFEFMQPYDTNITWYFNSNPIPGATSPVLAVTAAGDYTVQGAPTVCPNLISSLGVILTVQVSPCGAIDENIDASLLLLPNPASDYIYVQSNRKADRVDVISADGKIVFTKELSPDMKIDITSLNAGIYFCRLYQNDKPFAMRRFVIEK